MPEATRLVSNSELKDFKRCRRRWWLSWYRRLDYPTERRYGHLWTGTLVHGAMMAYYSTANEQAAFDYLAAEWETTRGALTDEQVGKDSIESQDMAQCVVEGYFEWLKVEGADRDFEVIAAETPLEAPSPVAGVNLIGKLDLLIRKLSSGRLLSLDHKTVQDLTSPIKTLHMDPQMKMYHLLQLLCHPEQRTDGTLWNMMRKSKRTARAKPPFYGRYEIYHSDVELKLFWNQLYGAITEIVALEGQLEAGADPNVVAFPTPHKDCSWDCKFFHVCSMLDDGRSDAEGHLAEFFMPGDPMSRYKTDVEA